MTIRRAGRAVAIVAAFVAVAGTAGTTAAAGASEPATQAGQSPGAAAAAVDPWTLTSTAYTAQDITRTPFVGNGYLAQRLPAVGQGYQGDLGPAGYQLDQRPKQRLTTSMVAGVYNRGLTPSVPGMEYMVSLPTWTTMALGVDGHTLDSAVPQTRIGGYQQRLDLAHGSVTTSMTWTPEDGRATDVRVEVLANRAQEHLAQVRLTVTPRWTGDLALSALLDGRSAQGVDATARSVTTPTDTATVQLSTPGDDTRVVETQHLVAGPGTTVSARTAAQPSDNSATTGENWTMPVTAGTTYTVTKYVGIATSNDPDDPVRTAARTVEDAAGQGWPKLTARHEAAWADLWQPNIEAGGDAELQADVNMSYYTLYSSLRAGTSWSIPPAGLTSLDYNGDIFWDADTWMFPSLLAFHPELARSVVMFRSLTRDRAEANAKANGYDGGIWAWDNGPGGVCGDLGHPMCVTFEDHLESDIALAQWQYYQATGDTKWLKDYGYPVLKDVAAFWAGRVTQGPDGQYHIDGVTGPDEYHEHVNDNATTNAGAVLALKNAAAAAAVVHESPDPAWTRIASRIAVPTDADGSHPEYAGYTDQTAKQADTVMLSYPLGYVTDPSSAAADLDRYMPVTDVNGPAMTNSVESVVAARVQQPGCLDDTLFENSYRPYLKGPFRQFAETQGDVPLQGGGYGPAFTFATGAGGFLQTFLYGFGGLRWDTAGLTLAPTLPPQLASGLTLAGVQYHGSRLSVHIGERTTTVTLDSGGPVDLSTPDGARTLTRARPVTLTTARPDLDPTDDLARCGTASADSAQPATYAAGAVDGNDTTTWTAAGTSSSLQVALAGPGAIDHLHVRWGTTRPDAYTVAVQDGSGEWRQVAQGAVPPLGDLVARWTRTDATGVRLSFSGVVPASVASLSVPRAQAADLSGALTAEGTSPGTPATVHLALTSVGGADAQHVVSSLRAPAGWQVSADPAPVTIAQDGHADLQWTVTPPADQATTAARLTATVGWDGTTGRDTATATAVLPVVTPAPLGSTIEAEAGALSGGAQVASDHGGYTGSGFVAGLYTGACDTVAVHVPSAGGRTVTIRYANSLGGQRPPLQNVTRTITLAAGGVPQQVPLPVTGSWDTWSTVTVPVNLPAGDDPISLTVGPADSGSVNIDSLTVT
ncbi:carbohydrate-binding protein [Actinacidiphila acididurans]|uniref:Carbohydrate-binding protein n=1 Tax=Actinacidiphila acididurans TaxID=2784346 RepID=A0ABS2TYV5_9ACTN|nr:carbohydrate-binding protein [Actinacidiphila acididurans]MBM9508171.1 carbohydrate-binding protein [Actinacidiphila acididurans]